MPRRPRFQAPDAIYHVTARGAEGRSVFFDDFDRLLFLTVLAKVVQDRGWMCPAYCLMTNHFHLLIQTPDADLAVGMHRLNSAHANYFNQRYDHVGHLFQSRYAAEVIEQESHLLEACRYIVLNPVRAGICRQPGRWRWSSYRATAGHVSPPEFLAAGWVLGQFGNDVRRAALRYVEFVAEGLAESVPRGHVRGLAPDMALGGR